MYGNDLRYISETVISECQGKSSQADGTQPCRDNLTLLIVSLKDYYNDFKSNHNRRYPKPAFDVFSNNSGENLFLNGKQLSDNVSFSSSGHDHSYNSNPLLDKVIRQASFNGS